MKSYLYPLERKLIIVTVISDLVTDHRVHKVCQTLHEAGYRVLLIGTKKKSSQALKSRDYQTDRIGVWINRTIFFYLEFNIRLFFRLLGRKGDIFLGNDLDVMPATLIAASLKRKPLVYDSHEYFLGMAGMDRKPLRRSIWKFIEGQVFSRLKYMFTVSDSISNLYRRNYHKKLFVVRNLPLKNPGTPKLSKPEADWIDSIDRLIPEHKNLLIVQSAGINESRGVEELVFSMLFLDGAKFHLLIVGGGDILHKIEKMVTDNQLSDKITLVPKVPFEVLKHFTAKANLGLSIEKPSVLNHKYSLSNKLFEYLHAGVPVLASRLPEQEKIINHYDVGGFIENHHPEDIARKIKDIFADPQTLSRWKQNTCRVREELNWENESKIVVEIFKQVEKESVNY
jgi:glycosyltransferase involved in cell wall biosynthesis